MIKYIKDSGVLWLLVPIGGSITFVLWTVWLFRGIMPNESNEPQEKPKSAFVLEASESIDGSWIRIVRIKETNERFLVTTNGVAQMSDAEKE